MAVVGTDRNGEGRMLLTIGSPAERFDRYATSVLESGAPYVQLVRREIRPRGFRPLLAAYLVHGQALDPESRLFPPAYELEPSLANDAKWTQRADLFDEIGDHFVRLATDRQLRSALLEVRAAKPEYPYLATRQFAVIHGKVFFYLDLPRTDRTALSQYLRWARGWSLVALFSSVSLSADSMPGFVPSENWLREFLLGIEAIAVGAFDGDSVLVWMRPSNGGEASINV